VALNSQFGLPCNRFAATIRDIVLLGAVQGAARVGMHSHRQGSGALSPPAAELREHLVEMWSTGSLLCRDFAVLCHLISAAGGAGVADLGLPSDDSGLQVEKLTSNMVFLFLVVCVVFVWMFVRDPGVSWGARSGATAPAPPPT
jgi:hypothetical protein